ncbi:SGNH/GDSL hydrolase family protein [Rothia nasimurium]|uniref:SGNH/GDSL hydrolase family protein n=1 Tax=Rothia nasimurium TaxID=85336 RepID=UPI001F411DB9|nr:SGNH/GDSL hydrolase family protein [Rothia nasimurium]
MKTLLNTEEPIRYVALGDSFTEGVGDDAPTRPNGVRGWADRVAEQFMLADPAASYANLAIRGRLLGPIIDEQLEPALALKPNLVSLIGGGNDSLRPGFDVDALASRYDAAFKTLRDEGIEVFTMTGFDPGPKGFFSGNRARVALFNEILREVADDRGVTIVDYWRMHELLDLRYWAPDRLHMNAAGHTLVARRVLETLSAENIQIGDPSVPDAEHKTRVQEALDNAKWAREFVVPWIGRRLRGTSSGDGISPKYPQLTRFDTVPEH